jgi:hypothetical protein
MAIKKVFADYGPLLVIEQADGRVYSLDGSYLAEVVGESEEQSKKPAKVPFTDNDKWEGDPATVIPLTEIPPQKQRGAFIFAATDDHPPLKISAAEYAALVEIAQRHTRPSRQTMIKEQAEGVTGPAE